jgi:hypothetical protein
VQRLHRAPTRLRQPIDPRAEVVLARDDHLGRADGVGAAGRQRNRDVTSVSWPTAEMVGTGQPAIAAPTTSSLKAPKVLDRAAAAADDHHVDAAYLPMAANAAGDVERRAVALHACRTDHDVRVGVPATQHLDDVANGRALGATSHADLAGNAGSVRLRRGSNSPSFASRSFN